MARGGVDAKVEMPHAANRVNASFIEEEGCLKWKEVECSVLPKREGDGSVNSSTNNC